MLSRFKGLTLSSTSISLLAGIPLVFVIFHGLQLGTAEWLSLWENRLPTLLWNTISLAVLVAIFCAVLGVSSAWLISKRQFVGRTLAIWLMVLPLAIPTYVFAYIFTILLDDGGWLAQVWGVIIGQDSAVPDLYHLGGVAFILTLTGFSYVFLMVFAALSKSNQQLEEVAKIHGASGVEIFFSITLPLLRPAMAASLAVVVLHVLSDFGAVRLLNYQTFTSSIYSQLSGRFNYETAAGLSLVLVSMGLTFLIVERFFRAQQRYYASRLLKNKRLKSASPLELVVIWGWIGLIAGLSFILPLAWMIYWTSESWQQGLMESEFWQYFFNTVVIAMTVASITVIAAIPLGMLNAWARTFGSQMLINLSSVGFVLPGPVVALGVLTFFLTALPALYGGFLALLFALSVRFLPLSVQTQESAFQQLKPSIEEAGRIHGAGVFENLRRVVLPLLTPGLVAAWVLVFIDVLKELPTTLILRPIGFDTLAVRIWIEVSEEMLELAAPASLLLVIATLPAMYIIMRNSNIQNKN